ncbi:hypothetical protein J6590_012135 [Homalodisca vitripennis]|nr:hypothetical protein J6590_012135 [Homalodisca vitripennis]
MTRSEVGACYRLVHQSHCLEQTHLGGKNGEFSIDDKVREQIHLGDKNGEFSIDDKVRGWDLLAISTPESLSRADPLRRQERRV